MQLPHAPTAQLEIPNHSSEKDRMIQTTPWSTGSPSADVPAPRASPALRILIAPDKFKGCLTAAEVAAAIRSGLASSAFAPGLEISMLPLADGGDGSVEAALFAGSASRPVNVHNADGHLHTANIAFDGTTAVVEVAGTCGLATLSGPLRPLNASSRGLGEAILSAALLKPARLVVALGGSASTDGGAGMLAALGATFRDARGAVVEPSGGELERIAGVDLSGLVSLAGIELVGASDVTNPLSGPDGAAHVFGPQKGACPDTVLKLDAGLRNLVEACRPARGIDVNALASTPGAGSAGGIGFAIMLLGGSLVSGADYFLDLLDFDARARTSHLVVTGEGRLDAQTADGKLISAVCRRAQGTPVWAVVGRSVVDGAEAQAIGLENVTALSDISASDTAQDPAAAALALEKAGQHIMDVGLPADMRVGGTSP